MARGLNKVMLIGNLGDNPKITKHNGFTIAHISIATSMGWLDKETGNRVEKTEWHRVVFFHKLAEVVEKYLSKGDKVYVEGYLRTNKWTDKENIERYSTEIVAKEMQMLGNKPDGKKQTESKTNSDHENHDQNAYEDDIPF